MIVGIAWLLVMSFLCFTLENVRFQKKINIAYNAWVQGRNDE